MGWGGRKNRVKRGMGDGSPGVAVVVKSNPRFLDENNVCCLVCEVEEGMHDICQFCCIVLDKAYGLVGTV